MESKYQGDSKTERRSDRRIVIQRYRDTKTQRYGDIERDTEKQGKTERDIDMER